MSILKFKGETAKEAVNTWKLWKRNLFRFLFIFLLFFIVPIDWKFYRQLFSIDWTNLQFYHLLSLARYQPAFFPLIDEEGVPVLGITSYANWLLAVGVTLIGGTIWATLDRKREEYTVLCYWLWLLVRYRLAIALLSYGFYKLFVQQIPYPSLSNLFTNYGDFYAWKIYFQTTGISPIYVSFLGFVEIFAALLILNRKTVTWGAGLVIGFLGNVAAANGFYDIGELSFSTLLVIFSVFLFAQDVPRLYNLLIKEKLAKANTRVPDYGDKTLVRLRMAAKLVVGVLVVLFAYTAYSSWSSGFGSYKLPQQAGLPGAAGFYKVNSFIINRDTLPYAAQDSTRWQDVIFEKWSTLSIKVNKPVQIDRTSADEWQEKDIDRNYELAGFSGRHYYHYDIDAVNHKLHLQNKNRHHRKEKLSLTYLQPNDSTLVLTGVNASNDSIKVALQRINKPYMLFEGRRKAARL